MNVFHVGSTDSREFPPTTGYCACVRARACTCARVCFNRVFSSIGHTVVGWPCQCQHGLNTAGKNTIGRVTYSRRYLHADYENKRVVHLTGGRENAREYTDKRGDPAAVNEQENPGRKRRRTRDGFIFADVRLYVVRVTATRRRFTPTGKKQFLEKLRRARVCFSSPQRRKRYGHVLRLSRVRRRTVLEPVFFVFGRFFFFARKNDVRRVAGKHDPRESFTVSTTSLCRRR